MFFTTDHEMVNCGYGRGIDNKAIQEILRTTEFHADKNSGKDTLETMLRVSLSLGKRNELLVGNRRISHLAFCSGGAIMTAHATFYIREYCMVICKPF